MLKIGSRIKRINIQKKKTTKSQRSRWMKMNRYLFEGKKKTSIDGCGRQIFFGKFILKKKNRVHSILYQFLK